MTTASAPPRLTRTRAERALTLLAVLYLAAVVLGVLEDVTADTLASSPTHVADGEAWRLLTSALAVEGDLPLLQVALTALAAAAVIRLEGAVAWWGAVICAHVGSAVVTYGLIGLFDAVGAEGAERMGQDPDYGVSVVLTGSLGALFAGAALRGERLLAGGALVAGLAVIPASLDWYGIEHPLGFLFGAAFAAWWQRRGAQ